MREPEVPVSLDATLSLPQVEIKRLVQKEQVKLSVEGIRHVPLSLLSVDVVLSVIAWRAGGGLVVWIWLLAITLCQVGRAWYVMRLHDQGSFSPGRLLRFMALTLTVQGTIHDLIVVIVFMLPGATTTRYVVSTIMMGVAAGAVSPVGGYLPAYVSWAAAFWVILGGAWLLQGTLEGVLMAALLFSLLALLSLSVRDQGRTLVTLVGLTESLRRARDRSEIERQRAEMERQRAEAASESRTRFFAAASHDLRQPLHALGINAATIAALADRSGDQMLAQVGNVIRRALTESRGLLDSLLEISQLDAGAVKAERREVDMAHLVGEVYEGCRPLANERGLTLEMDVDAPGDFVAHTDAMLVRRILQNLVGNAIKFTLSGKVRISLAADAAGHHLIVRVADTGPGIPQDQQQKIFEEFYQIGNPERDRSHGLGLGLAIVRRLAQLVGAHIHLNSVLGQGSTFEIVLPRMLMGTVAPTRHSPRVGGHSATPLQSDLRVLIVDDERDVRESLCTLLAVLGWQAQGVCDLSEALAAVQRDGMPDVMVLDFRLREGASGLEVLDGLRASGCQGPAILVTGETAPERIAAAQASGLPLVYKPVDGLELAALLRQLVPGHSLG